MSSTEIISIIQSVIETNHRGILVLKNKRLLPEIFSNLCKHTIGTRPQLLYLHSSSLEEVDFEEKDLVEIVKFKDSNKILGNTFGMLVIQDFELITANLLAKSVETLRGGGICCFLLSRTEILSKKPFFRRLFKSLNRAENVFFFNENNEIVKIPTKKVKKYPHNSTNQSDQYKSILERSSYNRITRNTDSKTLHDEVEEKMREKLFSLSKTDEQKDVLQHLSRIFIERNFKTVCSVSAARGRGKSAVLGLGIALALHCSFSTIIVAAPCIENVTTVFEFIQIGLTSLGYEQKIHFDLHHRTVGTRRLVHKITFRKRFLRQMVSFFDCSKNLEFLPDLMVIDEAAAMPLPQIKKLLMSNLVIMASTIDGYEGTGRVLAVKLFADLEKKSLDSQNPFLFRKLALDKPIRYSQGDPIENWLNHCLVLYAQPPKISSCPSLQHTDLFYINKEILFSGNTVTEAFLKQVISIFSASHYKNSPNDLQEISDNEKINLFVLTTKDVAENDLPFVICGIEIVDEFVEDQSEKSGNLTPFCLFENFRMEEILQVKGKRIKRIAVHPDMQKMGYGKYAVEILCQKIRAVILDATESLSFEKKDSKFQSDNYSSLNNCLCMKGPSKPQSSSFETSDPHYSVKIIGGGNHVKTLLLPLDALCPGYSEYLSVSFGANKALIPFWKKLGFEIIHVKAHPSSITGEFSSLYVRPFTKIPLFASIQEIFRRKFTLNAPSFYRSMEYSLWMDLFYNTTLNICYKNVLFGSVLDASSKECILMFLQGKLEYRHIAHLVQILARNFFLGYYKVILTPIEQSLLFLIGLQCQSIDDVHLVLHIEKYKVDVKISSAIGKLYDEISGELS